MLIYSFQRICYHCKNEVKTYTYIQYKAFYGDVEFPYPNWMMSEVYAHIHPDSTYFDKTSYALNYPVYTLGDNFELDKIVIESGKVPNISFLKSRMWPNSYLANFCPLCQKPYGKHHLLEHVTDQYLSPNIGMVIECDI